MLFSVVEHLDRKGDTIVARVPEQGSGEFNAGSQLIVQESQVAVFYRDGRMCDQFGPGRYTLNTNNIPILRSLARIAFGGKSPFRAYVYFVNLKTFRDLGWGTPDRILYRDTDFKRGVNLGANGTYAVRVTDHVRFLNEIVGTQGGADIGPIHDSGPLSSPDLADDTGSIKGYMRKIIAARFANVLAESQTSIYDLPARYDFLGAKLKKVVGPEFAQYGLGLVDLVILNISLPDEVVARINERARIDLYDAEDIAKAQQLAVADALPEAARNPGAAGTGVGIGVGLGAGIPLGQTIASQIMHGPPPAAGGPAPPPMAQWYAYVSNSQIGPMTPQQLAGAIQAGQVGPATHVWRQGMADWMLASQVSELASAFQPPSPPTPPPPGSQAR
jgi:membrane protease subunit (stomatin/prohibitin family)